MRLSGSILVNCSPLNSGIQLWESVTLGRPVLKDQAQQQVEQEISWKTWEVMCLQVKGDLEKKELQDRLKDLAALEGKRSLLQSELVVARETLEESHLQRDLLKQEKHELTRALEKAEQSVAELAGAPNKRSAEVADLHVATVKMSSINEALVLDKVQLKKLVLQLEQENDVLSAKVDKMERAKISDQEKLNLCERTNEELCTEKGHLEQLLKKAEEQQEGLQVELRILVEEKAETQEKLDELGNRRQPLAEGGTGLLDLPLGVKIPLLPGSKPVFCRTKLGEKLHQPSGYFNLGDPYCRLLSTEYNSLHDPHLQAYHKRKDNLQRLKREGYITSDGKVVCTLKELNEYRQYLTTLKVEAEKMFMREEASHCDQEAD
ncbi:uncharacterized protein LOC142089544 isoform X1 [Calonectris borealis]|uniref:uncharacterized protein LOC142089544 isoform X1 n=2 Tax=Calonectris borealis TaxID=1323832 RepID=UPI003F4BA993